jgi:purine-binding chemotaxis protein CheW
MNAENVKEDQLQQYVSFVLAGEEYGVPILGVQEIIRYETVTRVPQSSEFIEGVLNLRGQVIPVVNLRKKFNLEQRENDKSTRIIVVEVSGRVVGMVVDEVSEVLQINRDQISPPPPMGHSIQSDFISGMGKLNEKLIILLDINSILTEEEKVMVEQATT